MAEGGQRSPPRDSPPKAIIDTTPLLNSLEHNKESLKVKLMLRRPFDQLVAQGIMPPHKTPAAYHGQRRQLERAKTGDILKAKIQQRPSRQELERRHILDEDRGHLDPSLVEKQRMLKKARLADQLNDQLSHRPGPLELIQKNILHTEEPIENAVKAGRIPYKATCEGQLNRPQLPHKYVTLEDDSQSSEGDSVVSPSSSDVIETAAKSAGIVVSLIPATEGTVVVTTTTPVFNKDNSEVVFADLSRSGNASVFSLNSVSSPAASLVSSTSTLSPLSSVASPVPSTQPSTPAPPPLPVSYTPRPVQSPCKTDAPGKDKNRKKSKSKSIPKTRTIKFHEYKGPPSAQKNNLANNLGNNSTGESSYDLLLQQQTLLLQFQLQLQHKYPQIILPASQKNSNDGSSTSSSTQHNGTNSTVSEPTVAAKFLGRLEDMKVSDLKAELKRRSLPVSGSKPQLIERLKPFTGNNESSTSSSFCSEAPTPGSVTTCESNYSQDDNGSPQSTYKDESTEYMDVHDPKSPPAPPTPPQPPRQPTPQNHVQLQSKDDIVREQQRQIEELQRELTLSQLKLQAATRAEPKAQLIALQKHLQARQQNQQLNLQMQQLQALQAQHAQEQQRLQQEQHVAFQNQKNLTGDVILNGNDAALVLNHIIHGKAKIINGHNKASSFPGFLNTIVTTPVINAPDIKMEYSESSKPPPPVYEEATKQLKKGKHIKSQTVDDVLEILIKNGELPPSAANDPQTPGSADIKTSEPSFTNSNLSNNNNNNNNNSSNNNNNTVTMTSAPMSDVDPNSPEAALGLDPNELFDTLDTLENMDFSQLVMELGGQQNENGSNENDSFVDSEQMPIPMDTDDWLDSLLPKETSNSNNKQNSLVKQEQDLGGYDPLLGTAPDPFDPFCLEEYRSPADFTAALSWDKLDFAA
ncbi:MKL/myocardin-like protein 1 [Agrilus planipennis]|uniref:MKL/myocardin-like protein 1 n=1 Tax=Agrilus planipennis TaxID=224129 RepID=A0A1W4X6J8_AGRPL|nr:MKL/myocardin-like protein 1 [Agrilus planipennis]